MSHPAPGGAGLETGSQTMASAIGRLRLAQGTPIGTLVRAKRLGWPRPACSPAGPG